MVELYLTLRTLVHSFLTTVNRKITALEHDRNIAYLYDWIRSLIYKTEPSWKVDITYSTGDKRYYSNFLYQSKVDSNLGNTPVDGTFDVYGQPIVDNYWLRIPPEISNVRELTLIEFNEILTNSELEPYINYEIQDTEETYIKTNERIILKAITSNKISPNGYLKALNPDYQGIGVYSGCEGYDGYGNPINKGKWYEGIAADDGYGVSLVLTDQIVIYNGLHYRKKSDTITALDPATDTTNYEVVAKSLTTGYILEIDSIKIDWDYSDNTFVWLIREDKRGNVVRSYQPQLFSWGNDNVFKNNKPFGAELNNVNFRGIMSRCSFMTCSGTFTFDSTDVNKYDEIEFNNFVTEQTGNYTVLQSDINSTIKLNSTSNFELIFQQDSDCANAEVIPMGATGKVIQIDSGYWTVTAGTGVTLILVGLNLKTSQGAIIFWEKVAENTFAVSQTTSLTA